MRIFLYGALSFFLFVSVACSDKSADDIAGNNETPLGEASLAVADDKPKPYIELGDLDAIQRRGTLRLIAPRFDGADALPRQGIPVQDYQRIAEEFSASLGLSAQWHFVDGFTDLIPMLTTGSGDVIITNLSQTTSRSENVDFTQPINRVDEVIVSSKGVDISSIEKLGDITFTVPESTAFIETLNRHNQNNETPLTFNTVSSDVSNNDLLDGITSGQYQATIIDSNVAELLLLDYPDLHSGLSLQKNRPIGWATRRNSPQLMQALNEFLVSHYVSNTSVQTQVRGWASIKEHGRIRMLTLNNPASYFMWRGDLMGFDYELANQFAKQHSLHLSVTLKNSIPELIEALKQGEGDFIAASLTRSESRVAQGLSFSQSYLRLTEQLVGLTDKPIISDAAQLANLTIGVNPNTVFYERLKNWQQSGIALRLVEYPDTLTEELFDRLVDGEFDYMMADSHLVSMEQAYRDNIQVNLDLESDDQIAWAFRPQQTELEKQLNQFIKKEYRGLFYNVTFQKYFVNERKIRSLQAERVTDGSSLSPYDKTVQIVANRFGMDWRLLTAQMFQESRFNPKAKSFAGALGLMQVMPRTAKELGYSNLHEPQQGIEAGVAYLAWLADRFPGDIDFQERIFFQLAAYNAGAGHVRDARRLTQQMGLDKDRWFDNVEKAMLLLSKPEYYKKARFGYVRGGEPVNYVREIRARYLAYLNASQ